MTTLISGRSPTSVQTDLQPYFVGARVWAPPDLANPGWVSVGTIDQMNGAELLVTFPATATRPASTIPMPAMFATLYEGEL